MWAANNFSVNGTSYSIAQLHYGLKESSKLVVMLLSHIKLNLLISMIACAIKVSIPKLNTGVTIQLEYCNILISNSTIVQFK